MIKYIVFILFISGIGSLCSSIIESSELKISSVPKITEFI